MTRVHMVGICAEADIAPLRAHLANKNQHPLAPHAGLSMWPGAKIAAAGTTKVPATAEAIARALTQLGKIAPSLQVAVRVGGPEDSVACVAVAKRIGGELTLVPGGGAVVLPSMSDALRDFVALLETPPGTSVMARPQHEVRQQRELADKRRAAARIKARAARARQNVGSAELKKARDDAAALRRK